MVLAIVAGILYLLGRNAKSNVVRQLLWIFVASQLLAFLLVTLGWIVKWALVVGLIAVVVVALAYLFVDRR